MNYASARIPGKSTDINSTNDAYRKDKQRTPKRPSSKTAQAA
jgi:hypothetical protein